MLYLFYIPIACVCVYTHKFLIDFDSSFYFVLAINMVLMNVLLHDPKLPKLLLGKRKYYHLFLFLLNSTQYEYTHIHIFIYNMNMSIYILYSFYGKSNEIPKISLFSYVPENFCVNFSI